MADAAPGVEFMLVSITPSGWDLEHKAELDRPVGYGTTGTGTFHADASELNLRRFACGVCREQLELPADTGTTVERGRTKTKTIRAQRCSAVRD